MLVQNVLYLDGGNVFPARNDDVLLSVSDLNVSVGVKDGDVAGVEPSPEEGFRCACRVLQVPLHHGIATNQKLTWRPAVARHRLECLCVGDHQPFESRCTNALAGLQSRLLFNRKINPGGLTRACHRRARDLRDAEDVIHIKAHRRDRFEHCGRRR